MKHKLLSIIAVSVFTTSTAIAGSTTDVVYEDSLAYNYSGSELEIVGHSVPDSMKGASEDKAMSKEDGSGWTSIMVFEDSLADNYPGSPLEIRAHGDSDSDSVDVGSADETMPTNDKFDNYR